MESARLKNGRIVRSEDPLNLETPFENLDGFITPTSSFYVRTHFPIPKISKASWRVRVEGEVEQPCELSYDDLLKFKPQTIPVTLECAGNNRNLLTTKVKGVQWGLGAVGTAEWTGVPLSEILNRVGIRSAAHEVILEGADEGALEDPKAPRGHVRFAAIDQLDASVGARDVEEPVACVRSVGLPGDQGLRHQIGDDVECNGRMVVRSRNCTRCLQNKHTCED